MTIQVTLFKTRYPYLKNTMDENIKIIEDHGDYYIVEMNINRSMDILDIFHAGVKCGNDEMKEMLSPKYEHKF